MKEPVYFPSLVNEMLCIGCFCSLRSSLEEPESVENDVVDAHLDLSGTSVITPLETGSMTALD